MFSRKMKEFFYILQAHLNDPHHGVLPWVSLGAAGPCWVGHWAALTIRESERLEHEPFVIFLSFLLFLITAVI